MKNQDKLKLEDTKVATRMMRSLFQLKVIDWINYYSIRASIYPIYFGENHEDDS